MLGLDVALTDLGREIGGLRLVPRTEIAVLDKEGRVLAYPDMSRVLQREGDQARMRPLSELGVPRAKSGWARCSRCSPCAGGICTC